MSRLSTVDYFVIGLFLLAMTLLGLAVSRRQKTLRDYFQAGGNMPWWAVSISLYASLLTPMSFVGVTGWVFQKDSRWFIGNSVVGVIAISLAARIWVPLWSRLRPLSIYQFLEERFGVSLRIFGSTIFIAQMMFWLGNELVTAAGAFEDVTGYPGIGCLVSIVFICGAYTVIGGARSDIWTDVAQFFVVLLSFLVVAAIILVYFHWQAGDIYELASRQISPVSHLPHTQLISGQLDMAVEGTIWAIVFHRVFGVLGFGTEQVAVQRLMAIGSKRNMYRALFGFTLVDLCVSILAVGVAWGLIAFYQANPKAALPAHPDQIFVHYAVNFTPGYVRGLVMAALLAALMASYGTGLNSVASVVVNDFYRRFAVRNRPDRHYMVAAKTITFGFALFLLVFANWQMHHRESTAIQRVSQFSAIVAGPVATFFMLGVFSRRANTRGAFLGGIASLSFSLSFSGIPDVLPPLSHSINWMWIGGLSTSVGLVFGYLGSLLFAAPSESQLKGLTLVGSTNEEVTEYKSADVP